ncbi:hypothetical protein LINPERHAP2_LOCUS40058, partial [Linum perenne]
MVRERSTPSRRSTLSCVRFLTSFSMSTLESLELEVRSRDTNFSRREISCSGIGPPNPASERLRWVKLDRL